MNGGPTSRPLLCGTHQSTVASRDPPVACCCVPPHSGTHNLSTSTVYKKQPPRPCSCPARPRHNRCLPSPVLPRTFLFLFSGNGPRRRRRGMSTSASGSQKLKLWPRYGEVPMTRCPDCPRPDPLKRLTCVRSTRGNVGREFVKCESARHRGKDGKVGFVRIGFDLA